ncbi:hepatic lectin-like [Mustelus asterias]
MEANTVSLLSENRHIIISNLTSNSSLEDMKVRLAICKRGTFANKMHHFCPKRHNFQCPDQWKQFQQNCYYFSSNKKNWLEAQRSCASMDANLVVINKAEEQMFVARWLQGKYHWIGLSDSVSEGDWRWVDGTDYTSSVKFWDNNQPNGEDENCVTMFIEGKWHDWPCSFNHLLICEKSA